MSNLAAVKVGAALFIFCVALVTIHGEDDGESWTWGDDKQKTSKADARCVVNASRSLAETTRFDK